MIISMPTLVLVHIGEHFPEYINDCILKLQSVTSIPIHILASQSNLEKITATNSVTKIDLKSIPPTEKTQEFEKKSKLNSSFRGGFWKFAMMRFFYIYDYVVWRGLTDIFHIENDNLVYMDFLPFLEHFQKKQMWCIMDSKTRCIPSFLYFKDQEIISKLLSTCIQSCSESINDMFALGKFRNDNKDQVGLLPIIGSYADPIDAIFMEYAETFKCVFDAAAVGQYIGGIDTRNTTEPTKSIGFINEACVIKCDKAIVEWKNKMPYLNGLPLVNLHIHSKDLKRWI